MVTRRKPCFCDKCFIDGTFATEGACDGWEHDTIKRVDTIQEAVENEAQVPLEVDEEFIVDDWVAALYQGTWYIGKIVEVDTEDGDFYINFMTKTKLRGSYTFKHPTKQYLIWIYGEHILCKITKPVAMGKTGRSFSLPQDPIEKIERSL